MLLRLVWRLLAIVLLLIALIFFVALLMDLGGEGDTKGLQVAAPAAARFTIEYIKGLSQGDLGNFASRFGKSTGTPVLTELGRALPKSLGLLAVALVLAVVAGLYLGVVAALRRTSRIAGIVIFISTLGMSTPSFFAAMLLIWLGVWLYRTTGQQYFPLAGFGWDLHLLLPALVLAARPTAVVTRLSFNAMKEIMDADYIRTARSKGLKQGAVLMDHALRNAGVPVLTTVGVSLRFSLAILPIVEYIFSWPGIGQLLLDSIQRQDTTAVVGMILPLALLFVLINQLMDVLYVRLDPRLRAANGGAA